VSASFELPIGMRDLLPREAKRRRALSRKILDAFARKGYEPISTAVVEFESVVERGLTGRGRREIVRLVDPGTGAGAALRPDITPQVARLVATRLKAARPPFRLAYDGSVIRHGRDPARPRRQIPQAGIELVGVAAPKGELEVISLLHGSLRKAGLHAFLLELGLPEIARAPLAALPEGPRADATEALGHKDASGLRAALARAPAEVRNALLPLPFLFGDVAVLAEARRVLRGKHAERALASLASVCTALSRAGLDRIAVDLKDFEYYTGVTFQALARGPGDAVASGGRYDGLCARYGRDLPAIGFAIDVENLENALGAKEPGVS
jgi:ATP phosphoribosyltransferase regulatory subunit